MLPELALLLSTAATQLTTLQPSHVVLEGSSNVTHWRCRSNTVEAALELEQPLAAVNAAIDAAAAETEIPQPSLRTPRFHLRVPVAAIRCGNRLMEREMLRALRGREHPQIEYRFRGLAGSIRHEPGSGLYVARVDGDLTVAGVTRPVTLEVQGWRLSPTSFYLRTATPLRMLDFGVKPPTALFGLIRTRNDVRVYFDLRLAVAKE